MEKGVLHCALTHKSVRMIEDASGDCQRDWARPNIEQQRNMLSLHVACPSCGAGTTFTRAGARTMSVDQQGYMNARSFSHSNKHEDGCVRFCDIKKGDICGAGARSFASVHMITCQCSFVSLMCSEGGEGNGGTYRAGQSPRVDLRRSVRTQSGGFREDRGYLCFCVGFCIKKISTKYIRLWVSFYHFIEKVLNLKKNYFITFDHFRLQCVSVTSCRGWSCDSVWPTRHGHRSW